MNQHVQFIPGADQPAPHGPPLTPSQTETARQVVRGVQIGNVVAIKGGDGVGRTVVLEHIHGLVGGRMLSLRTAFERMANQDPAKWEEMLIDLLSEAHEEHDIVLFDDMEFAVPGPVGADRGGYGTDLIAAYMNRLVGTSKKLVVTSSFLRTDILGGHAIVALQPLRPQDYQAILEHHAGRPLPGVDFDELYRAHRQMTASGLTVAGKIIKREDWDAVTTEALIALVDEYIVQSNVELTEVADVSFDTLVGVEDLVDTLDRTILIPMTQPQLAKELGLKPKRGVLLYGPPGTGKTTVGRALARRMKGKFFMIDGTFRPDEFGFQVAFDRILFNAQRSSPAVIFIDDADVIFRNGESVGLARKLLSKLDGLEGEAQSHVCVVMTAMDVSDMPPALVRSGRVEVWLEMKLPDADTRKDMIRYYAKDMQDELAGADWDALASASEGFTPADIRGLVGDARAHLAYDQSRTGRAETFEAYLNFAAAEISSRKAILSQL